jgi:hypothetical protein
MRRSLRAATFAILFAAIPIGAQEGGKPLSVAPSVRLAAAKSVFLRNGGGSDIPFEVISLAFSEWGRFAVVTDSTKADLIVEVASPDDGKKKKDEGGGGGLSGQIRQGGSRQSEPPPAPTSTRSDVLLAVYDAKAKVTLWSSTEQTKSVQKGMSKEERFAAAGVRLMARFRERIDPTPEP